MADQVLIAPGVDETRESASPQHSAGEFDREAFRDATEIEFHPAPRERHGLRSLIEDHVLVADQRADLL